MKMRDPTMTYPRIDDRLYRAVRPDEGSILIEHACHSRAAYVEISHTMCIKLNDRNTHTGTSTEPNQDLIGSCRVC